MNKGLTSWADILESVLVLVSLLTADDGALEGLRLFGGRGYQVRHVLEYCGGVRAARKVV